MAAANVDVTLRERHLDAGFAEESRESDQPEGGDVMLVNPKERTLEEREVHRKKATQKNTAEAVFF